MSNMTSDSVSLVIPIYNESGSIHDCVNRCMNALSKDFNNYEIVLVNDGSKDNTSSTIEELSKQYDCILPVQLPVNLNVGAAVQFGLCLATKQFVVHNAVDLCLAPEDIREFVDKMERNDLDVLVIERKASNGYAIWRHCTSQINRLIRKILFPRLTSGIVDMNFVQMYRSAILPRIMPLAKSPAFTTPEIIIRARLLKLKTDSIISEYHPRSEGKGAFGKPHDIIWTMYDMIRFRIRLWLNKL